MSPVGALGAVDFTTLEVWTVGELVTFYLLFVMEIATRRVHFAGCTPHPDDLWMQQIARNLTDAEDGFFKGKRYHGERNHPGVGNRILVPGDEVGRVCGEIQCRERLGGLLRYYYRKAA